MPRPRTPKNYDGTLIGAIAGGLLSIPLGGLPLGLGLGALAGSALNPQGPLPLQSAIALYLASKAGLAFAGMERIGWNRLRVVFSWNGNHFYVDAAVQPNKSLYASEESLDDALYDAFTRKLDERVAKLGVR